MRLLHERVTVRLVSESDDSWLTFDFGRPMHGAAPALAVLLGRRLDGLVEDLPLGESVSARVRHVIKDDLASASVSVERVARQLAMSARTLARRLEPDGTSLVPFLIPSGA
ncbi:MAG TPA: hypothetical protein VMX54_18340 [Vicinamibacteria bacterium]|nr:hypothetical protein [Vicinamibacteria bacterium]